MEIYDGTFSIEYNLKILLLANQITSSKGSLRFAQNALTEKYPRNYNSFLSMQLTHIREQLNFREDIQIWIYNWFALFFLGTRLMLERQMKVEASDGADC